VSYPVTPHIDPTCGQVVDHAAAAGSRICQLPGIDPGHDPEGFGFDRNRLVVEGGFRQSQQLTLTPNRELRMILIDPIS
jgi:hypothetical protein